MATNGVFGPAYIIHNLVPPPADPNGPEPVLLDINPDDAADVVDPEEEEVRSNAAFCGEVICPPPFTLTPERWEKVIAAWEARGRKTLNDAEVRALFTVSPPAS